MVFDKSAIFGLVVEKLDFDEFPAFFVEVQQKILFVNLEALFVYKNPIVVAHDILFGLVDIHRL